MRGWENVSIQKNIFVARKGDGLVIRSRAVKAMPEEQRWRI